METPDEISVVCVDEDHEHIEESILTRCYKCGRKVWCSITNAHHKTICLHCVIELDKNPEHTVEMFITPETMAEALREIAKIEKKERQNE